MKEKNKYLEEKMILDTLSVMNKRRSIKITDYWRTTYGDIRCHAFLYENGKMVASVIGSYNVKKDNIKELMYQDFDNLLKLPKIQKCSKLLRFIYDSVCSSEETMCYITDNDWNCYYADNFNDKDITKLKEEVEKYNLKEVITFEDFGYKIIGWGDLEIMFNDDRKLEKNKDKER